MIVTVPAMLLALNLWRLTTGRFYQQRMTDVASHSAAIELTSEVDLGSGYRSPLLYGDPTEIQTLCQNATDMAVLYASKNYVDGASLPLDVGMAQTDVKFGSFDFSSATPTFAPIDPTTPVSDATTLQKRSINAVRVEGHRTATRMNALPFFGPNWIGTSEVDVITRTTVALDRRVVGFRIQANLSAGTYQAIPLAPVGILSRSVDSPAMPPPDDTLTWEYQVERDAAPADPTQVPIDYHNLTLKVPSLADKDLPTRNARLMAIGVSDIAGLNGQLLTGLTSTHMTAHTAMNPQLVLDPDQEFTVPVPQIDPPNQASGDYTTMIDNFTTLMNDGTERAWPLYKTADGTTVTVCGFVAARIVGVTPMGSYIELELQPTLLETPTAFTDTSTRFLKDTSAFPYATYSRLISPYNCRVRLVD